MRANQLRLWLSSVRTRFWRRCAVRAARHGDVAIALRHDPLEVAEDRGLGSDDGSSRVDFALGSCPYQRVFAQVYENLRGCWLPLEASG